MFVALDIGGTSMRVAAVSSLGKVKITAKEVVVLRTKNRYRDDVRALVEAIRSMAPGRVQEIGVSVAGRVDRVKGMVVHSPNILSWNKKPLAADLKKAFRCAVSVENDAACAALGEAVYGKTRGDFYFLIWGTGIGGTLVRRVGKSLLVTPSEPGHQLIPLDGRAESFERVSGGVGIQRLFRKAPEELKAGQWAQVMAGMEIGMANLLTVCPVPTVVFGGGMSVHHATRVPALRRQLVRQAARYPLLRLPAFRLAAHGDFAGLYGAFACLKMRNNVVSL